MSISSGCMSLLTMMDLICPSTLGMCQCYDGLDIFISSGCMSLLTMMDLIYPSPLGVCRCRL